MKNISVILGTFFIACGVLALLFVQTRVVHKNLQKMTIGTTHLSVEVADTSQTITHGLSDRDAIGADGMLFVLPHRTIPSFWMKDMRFGLDFVWIDGNTIIDVTEHVPVPKPGTLDQQLLIYHPRAAVTHVLEVPDGFVAQHGLHVGDSMNLDVR